MRLASSWPSFSGSSLFSLSKRGDAIPLIRADICIEIYATSGKKLYLQAHISPREEDKMRSLPARCRLYSDYPLDDAGHASFSASFSTPFSTPFSASLSASFSIPTSIMGRTRGWC
ncbi:hypothetical protein [Methanothrix sp.]|uniref:hypothetical protein n=1 Tax=Methanothrix sp. TaxID=90426 RepID=UPI0032AEE58C